MKIALFDPDYSRKLGNTSLSEGGGVSVETGNSGSAAPDPSSGIATEYLDGTGHWTLPPAAGPWKEPVRAASTVDVPLLDYALGATATANNIVAGSAALAVDGDDATECRMTWFALEYVHVDLGVIRTISAFRVYETTEARIIYLQSSSDDATWATQATVASGAVPIDTGVVTLASPVTARYWRLWGPDASASYWGISTFSLFAGGLDLLPGTVLDGVTLAAGDRVLVKDQTTGADNGIYVIQAVGSPLRAYDMDVSTEVLGALVNVVDGTANAGTFWTCTNTTVPTLGTDALTFAQLSGGGGSISVTDGSTTVNPATEIDFTSGAVVSDLGGGVAGVAIAASSGAHFLVISSGHSAPLVFGDIVQDSGGDDFIYTT